MDTLESRIEFDEWKGELDNLNTEFEKTMVDPSGKFELITDGPLDPKAYFGARRRVAWLMKEAYDVDDGGWQFQKVFANTDDFRRRFVFGTSKSTWQPVAYVAYSVSHGFPLWDDMNYLRDDPSMLDSLSEIAWVNIQKLPGRTGSNSSSELIQNAFHAHRDLLGRQIAILDPQVIICGGTFQLLLSEGGFEKLDTPGPGRFFRKDGQIYVEAYHPSQRTVKRGDYIDGIVTGLKSLFGSDLPHG